jgi:hypothetical protein
MLQKRREVLSLPLGPEHRASSGDFRSSRGQLESNSFRLACKSIRIEALASSVRSSSTSTTPGPSPDARPPWRLVSNKDKAPCHQCMLEIISPLEWKAHWWMQKSSPVSVPGEWWPTLHFLFLRPFWIVSGMGWRGCLVRASRHLAE